MAEASECAPEGQLSRNKRHFPARSFSIRIALMPLRKISGLLLLMPALLSLAGCGSPRGATQYDESAAAETEVYTVMRAQPPDGNEAFSTAYALNAPQRAATLNDTARMLAGLPTPNGRDSFADVRGSSGWRSHQQQMNGLWADYLGRHELPIRQWAAREIGDLQNAGALFYPFSGPDFLFANAFFPRAETVVLCGLESAEPLPQLSSLSGADIEAGLDGLREALNNVMQFSFFITKDMRTDLQSTRFRGVLPVLLVFLARSGHSVESVDSIRLDASGHPVLMNGGGGAANGAGLLIRARTPQGASRRVFYFRQDLSNDSVRPGVPLLNFVSQLGQPPAFTKSASYLMHEDSFSGIRDFLMQGCRALVQDPSGVPYQHLVRSGKEIRLYGSYQGTLDIFREHGQPDLVEAYRQGRHPVQPLEFGVGYLYSPASTSLMVARSRR